MGPGAGISVEGIAGPVRSAYIERIGSHRAAGRAGPAGRRAGIICSSSWPSILNRGKGSVRRYGSWTLGHRQGMRRGDYLF